MSTCRWCTPGGSDATDFLRQYASGSLLSKEEKAANEDLCFCLECVVEYHRAREELPSLHKCLWKLETSRLLDHFEKSLKEEVGEEDDLFIVEDDQEIQIHGITGPEFENNLRVPLLEILKYPYLLVHPKISELCVEALCRMEKSSSFQVFDKHSGIYLLLVHPDETVRKWAIRTARSLGKVDRDDFYDLQDVFSCMFKVIELDLFLNSDIYSSSVMEEGKLILLPPHLYDSTNYKDYWLGICMLLTVLDSQAMDSLLLGPDKQNDLMHSILNTMEKSAPDEGLDPFWPALQCFMVILDRLGSKVWGQLIDPTQAFQTIIGSRSYNQEIENMRRNTTGPKIKVEPDQDENMVTCSQIVYDCNTKKQNKDTGSRSALSTEHCSIMYEEMQSLVNVLQSDMGQEMRVHNSTFLWFIPFVQSVMDLKDLSIVYTGEIIHHLCAEIKDLINGRVQQCDKVTEFFILILVFVIELHRNKNCMNLLWFSSQKWVEVLVKCATLSSWTSSHSCSTRVSSTTSSSMHPQVTNVVPQACIQLIRSLLREGCQLNPQSTCKQFLDKLNLQLRKGVMPGWDLSHLAIQDLQVCLRQLVKFMKDKKPALETGTGIRGEKVVMGEETSRLVGIEEGKESRSPFECKSGLSRPALSTGEKDGGPLCFQSNLNVKEERPWDDAYFAKPSGTIEVQDRVEDSNREPKIAQMLQIKKEKDLCTDVCGMDSNSDTCSVKRASDIKGLESKMEQNISSKLKPDLGRMQDLKSRLAKVFIDPSLIKKEKNDGSPGSKKQMLGHNISKEKRMGFSLEPTEKKEMDAPECLKSFPVKIKQENTETNKQLSIVQCFDTESGSDNEDDVPLMVIKSNLEKKRMFSKEVNQNPLTDSQVDRDLGLLSLTALSKSFSFPLDSSQESSVRQLPDRIERKVRSNVRNIQKAQEEDDLIILENPVIIISDSDSAKEENDLHVGKNKVQQSAKPEPSDVKIAEKDLDRGSSPPLYNEYDSQLFEFETEDEVFSAWDDSQMDNALASPETEQESLESSKKRNSSLEKSPDLNGMYNDWGYDTDYVPDDVIEKAAEQAEKQLMREQEAVHVENTSEVSTPVFYGVKRKSSTDISPDMGSKSGRQPDKNAMPSTSSTPCLTLAQKLANKRESCGNKVTSKISNFVTSPKAAQNERKATTAASSRSTAVSCKTTSPAIVPPKKVRQREEPKSTAEKLGLKKKERKAFDLSQRSLDCVAELRNYGQHLQVEKQKRRRKSKKCQNTMLISPQKLVVKGNKKLLASQDLQFFRQSRPKKSEQVREPSKSNASEVTRPPEREGADRDGDDFFHLTRPDPASAEINDPEVQSSEKPGAAAGSHTVYLSKTFHQRGHGFPQMECQKIVVMESKEEIKPNDVNEDSKHDDDDDDQMCLTQMDPIDMDLCSQLEYANDYFAGTQRDPVDMEIDEPGNEMHAIDSPSVESFKTGQVDNIAAVCSAAAEILKSTSSKPKDDHLFLKPGMPLSLIKIAKPSTTKIYTPSSRSATLAQELDNPTKTPKAGLRNKLCPMLPPRKPSVPPPECRQPALPKQPAPISSYKHPSRDVSQVKRAPVDVRPMSSVVQQPPKNISSSQQYDLSFLIQQILEWNHEMFENFSQFGTPDNLCTFPLKEVPEKFSSFDEYFATFYPLLMVNTFEELVQEWQKNMKSRKGIEKMLNLNGIEYQNRVSCASFSVPLHKSEVDRQQYPKEDDLVFLWLPQHVHAYTSEEREVMEPVAHFGCVSRSNVSAAGQNDSKAILYITIKTRGNVSAVHDQPVKCVVIGSLISTLRAFKALYSLRNNMMARAILGPHVSFFRPGQENKVVNLSILEYNDEQQKAINSAIAMVKQPQRTPKICLIHGPPGTGKTKTIVGLLESIFSEDQENSIPVENRRLKGRKPRVLLCAPSNAAVDHLMKKIILDFKEKSRDHKNPLGNCGDINLVRLGMEKAISKDLLGFSLDNQTKIRTQRGQTVQDTNIYRRKEDLDQQIDNLSRQCAMHQKVREKFQQLTDEKCRLLREREQLGRQLKETRSRKQEVQARVLQDAHVICCTLSTSGSILLESAFRRLGHDPFSCVIVDEAGQATEMETLIPLTYRCPALVLVGDPEQLPPTVISQKAREKRYDQSLMARLWKCLHRETKQNPGIQTPINFLSTQYRMHPDICEFPSKYIYKRALKTDGDTAEKRCGTSWPFQPYRLFDVTDGYETKAGESFHNDQEVKLVMQLIKLIVEKQKGRVGVITHYSAQKQRIKDCINREGSKLFQFVEVDTVDGFQGREKDCIIVSCVRASNTQGSIGFLGNRQRLNVTITRAKCSLFILGHLKTLMDHRDWGALIQDAHKRGTIIKTREKDYKTDAVQIFKPEPGLLRSFSYPPVESRLPSKPVVVQTMATASNDKPVSRVLAPTLPAANNPTQVTRRRASDTQGSLLAQPPVPAKPSTSERPRDPRLSSRAKEEASKEKNQPSNNKATAKGPQPSVSTTSHPNSRVSGANNSTISYTAGNTPSARPPPPSAYKNDQDYRHPSRNGEGSRSGPDDHRKDTQSSSGQHNRLPQKRPSNASCTHPLAKRKSR
ncbi:probable helicase senataxin [Acipenser ruthenus]|uniref:probable helicase senataxin n=1 Tax=Acipenser ruthenus TaxID=7906 RepID=UPI00145B3719|nr:probable helicase senataxin [Acipenser ruthenus]XP_058861512.1 probable helicase senataxin [Acipenser ruthenus]XP_058861513.1 probable helicase senataxin [Acipenser ruthenus]XP_058861514.1 probable helicase senataxin [Acipenser ruthenus]